MTKEALLIFAKNPVYGKVKTRLAISIGNKNALSVYNQLLQHTFSSTESLPIHKILFYSDYINENDNWNNKHFEKKVQEGADLGQRMRNAFTYALQYGFEKIVIIGTDCPELSPGIIMNAFECLDHTDIILGPAFDGGYYLLGMKKLYPCLFENIEWSSSTVLQATIEICIKHKLSYELLAALHDVDDVHDLVHLRAISPMLSIIIPTYNEAGQIADTIIRTQAAKGKHEAEIIVVDGGSTDDTIAIANNSGARTVLSERKGRAAQMNKGASVAQGELLYFLHADSIPPQGFTTKIYNAYNQGYKSGCFHLAFDHDHWFLKANAWFTRFNINAVRFGDQSLFVTKEVFKRAGGFREDLLMMEDQEIIHRIKKYGKFIVLDDVVITSARKYIDNGVYRMQGIFYCIWAMYYLGYSQEQLLNLHRRLIHKHKL